MKNQGNMKLGEELHKSIVTVGSPENVVRVNCTSLCFCGWEREIRQKDEFKTNLKSIMLPCLLLEIGRIVLHY